jgi:prepilin-type processing-associated H-X9-DG protein
MGASLASVQAPADIVYLQELRWLTRVAWLRPVCTAPNNCSYWCWWAPDGKPGYSYHHMEGANFIYIDGHAKYRKTNALQSGEFGLTPSTDRHDASGSGHNGVCGKRYAKQL